MIFCNARERSSTRELPSLNFILKYLTNLLGEREYTFSCRKLRLEILDYLFSLAYRKVLTIYIAI